ncbi:MAG TPA: hypothetical protein VK184_08815 [Nostocaceae cyanobacterium]|nr:hypothetical protein [Nostocaceae cyanobacterium]
MFTLIRRFLHQFFRKSRTIDNEPLNKVSLIVIIVIDIFILVNVFTGLDDISRWHLDPYQAYPCHYEWDSYRTSKKPDKDYEIIRNTLTYYTNNPTFQPSYLPPNPSYLSNQTFRQNYLNQEKDRLGKVYSTCLEYAEYKDKINTKPRQATIKTIENKQEQISKLERTNSTIRSQYDSSLLERIANQPRNQSINLVGAEKAKQELDKNNAQISTLKKEIDNLKQQLVSAPESVSFFQFLKDDAKFNEVNKGYRQASFWYPSIQFGLQSVFLLPLILIAALVHNFAQRRRYGLIALISWHLLVIFCIPLLLKVFQFLQVDIIFQFVFDIIRRLVGNLLFLVSYIYILLVPLIGFGIIKFFQKVVFNSKVQAANRVQKLRCVRCAKKIRRDDLHCPHCGYHQYVECPECHNFTYRHLPYCKHCGSVQISPDS